MEADLAHQLAKPVRASFDDIAVGNLVGVLGSKAHVPEEGMTAWLHDFRAMASARVEQHVHVTCIYPHMFICICIYRYR